MQKWLWIERTFDFDYPVEKWPDLLERVRGTPARLEEALRGLPSEVLTARDGKGWSIQENVGHLLDLEPLVLGRVEEILAGAAELTPADMTNRMTQDANHNQTPIAELLQGFRAARAEVVRRLERMDASDWGKAAFHERLQRSLRVVDIACMTGEHDDYHLARIRELIGTLS